MKIALLGAGKTGKKVIELHPNTIVFNSSNKPTLAKLKECDVVISFLAGDVFFKYIDLLLASRLPVITGSTGFSWPKDIEQKINDEKLNWVYAHNFSLGMNIVKSMIETLSKAGQLYPECQFNIHDIHHSKKLDAPSGTALSWKDWLNKECEISSERTGDVIGYHHLEMHSQFENIKIIHEATDRSLFASGALWAAQLLFKQQQTYGFIAFNKLVTQYLKL